MTSISGNKITIKIMSYLYLNKNAISIIGLSKHTHTDYVTTTEYIKELEKIGLIKITHGKVKSKSCHIITLTPKGEEIASLISQLVIKEIESIGNNK